MMYALPDKTYKEYTKEETRRDNPDWVSDADGLLAWLEQRYNKFRQVQPREAVKEDKSKKAKGAAAATTTAGGDVPPTQAATTAAAPAGAGAVPKQPKKAKAKSASTGSGKSSSKPTNGGADKTKKKEKLPCPFCGVSNAHNPSKCPELESMDIKDRWAKIKAAKVCFLCMIAIHMAKDCTSGKACGIDGCKRTHHKELHGTET